MRLHVRQNTIMPKYLVAGVLILAFLSGCGEGEGEEVSPVLDQLRASPNLLVASEQSDRDWEMFIVGAGSSPTRQVTAEVGYDLEGTWSPDGDLIAITSSRGVCSDGAGTCPFDLYVLEPNGSVVTRLTYNGWSDVEPAWSPDGRRIAFRSDRTLDVEIFVMDTDGKNATQLTEAPGEDWTPTWSPDGSQLAFASKRDGSWDIYVMDSDGSQVRQVTDGPGHHWLPAWSPDGSTLAFASSNQDDNWDIFTIGVDGTGIRQITDDPGIETEPVWSPDGSTLAIATKQPTKPYELKLIDLASGSVADTGFSGFPTDWLRVSGSAD